MKPSSSCEASECDPVGSLNCVDLYEMHWSEHCRCLIGEVIDKTLGCYETRAYELTASGPRLNITGKI
jgi:hypothetical protein